MNHFSLKSQQRAQLSRALDEQMINFKRCHQVLKSESAFVGALLLSFATPDGRKLTLLKCCHFQGVGDPDDARLAGCLGGETEPITVKSYKSHL